MGRSLVLEPGLSGKLADVAGRGAGDHGHFFLVTYNLILQEVDSLLAPWLVTPTVFSL